MNATLENAPRLKAFETILPDAKAAHAEFAKTGALVWRDAFDPHLLGRLMALCDRSRFYSDTVEGLGHREVERPPLAGTAITLALRRAPLFDWLESVTGCGPITTVEGRIVQTWPRAGDELTWHNDIGGESGRRLGVTIAMGEAHYEGGHFEMRRYPSAEHLLSWKHDRPGTVLIFEVSHACEHRVRPLQSGGPRRVYTGWFMG